MNYGIGTIKIFGPSYHSERWYEVHASRLGAKHFDRHYGRGAVGYKEGDANYFDIKSFSEGTRSKYVNPRTGYVNNYVDYKNGINYYDPHIIHGHRHSLWDYLVPFTFFW